MKTEIDIESVVLSSGSHSEPNGEFQACVMELSSYIAKEPWSDHPACVSPVLGAFLRSWNDSLDHETRQKLKPYAAKVIGTAGDSKDEQRAWMAVDWLARTQLPVWLDLAGLTEHAAAVRAIIAISDPSSASAAQPTLNAAWAAAKVAARAAARVAARDAARRDAAGAAAWDAAWAAAAAAAWAAAGAAARDAAWAAAAAAAWAAAGAAARDALKPSVLALQGSAFELLDRMTAL